MRCCTNSFPRRTSVARLAFLAALVAMAALDAHTQSRQQGADIYKKISLKTKGPCAVGSSGEVTSLIRDEVELSVNEDFDCDGVADAYDNCVGMPNPAQIDSDGDRVGDVCETAVTVKRGMPGSGRSKNTPHSRQATAIDRRSRSSARTRRNRLEQTKLTRSKVASRKSATKRKTKT
jgi:hypothetical protein